MRVKSRDASSRVQEDNRIPITRTPITQDQIATALAQSQATGKPIDHPAGEQFGNVLHGSITRMVGMIAGPFSLSCNESSDDLVQECFKKVFDKIYTFDTTKAKFTTWCWWVCMNTLRRRYSRASLRFNVNNFVDPMDIAERSPSVSKPEGYEAVLRDEIIDIIDELVVKHPKHRQLILEMFGNPVKGQSTITEKPLIKEAAKRVGVTHQWAYTFYSRSVRPYFMKRFGETR